MCVCACACARVRVCACVHMFVYVCAKNIKSNVKLFADCTIIFSIINGPVISADELNHDLEVINHWAYQWKMEFNPDPKKEATELL